MDKKSNIKALGLFSITRADMDFKDTDILLPPIESPITPSSEYVSMMTLITPTDHDLLDKQRREQYQSSTLTYPHTKPECKALNNKPSALTLISPPVSEVTTTAADRNNNADSPEASIPAADEKAGNTLLPDNEPVQQQEEEQRDYVTCEGGEINITSEDIESDEVKEPVTSSNGITLLLNNESLRSVRRGLPRKGSHGSYSTLKGDTAGMMRKFSLQNPKHAHFSEDRLIDETELEQKKNAELEAKRRHSLFGDMGLGDGFSPERRSSLEQGLKNQLFSFFQASDNKLAMKLFGSRTALLKEKRRQFQAHTWVIHPCSNFRLYWDLLMLIFLVTNLVVLPVAIAFFFDDVGTHWIIFNVTCDTLFILDIFINFRTGLIDQEAHGDVILDSRVIALRYLKGWFVVDFFSSLPIDYIFLTYEGHSFTAGRAIRILRLAKLLQLLRLLRISRLVRYVRIWQEYFSLASIVVRIFNLICVMMLLSHWSGCIQFFVPVIQNWPEDSWITIEKLHNIHWWDQYTKSLFKALSHMLCIGYGTFPPRNNTDTWLTIASMVAGATCYALFVGHATTLIQSFDSSSRQFRDHLQQVNEYMSFRKLPPELKQKITTYYDHRFGGKMFDEQVILTELSDSLRSDILNHNCRELIHTVPFFINADPNFVSDVISHLKFEMFMPGDTIIKANTKGDRMFFIQEGVVEVVGDDDKVVTRLADGSYFGEIALLANSNRTATVRATTYCNLFSLSREHFDQILTCYPVMRRTLETIAAQRLHHLGKDPALVTSRESLLDDVSGIRRVMKVDPVIHSDEETNKDDDSDTNTEHNNPFLNVVKGFFTKDSDNFSRSRMASRNSSRAASPKRTSNFNTNCSSNGITRSKSGIQYLFSPSLPFPLTRKVRSSVDLRSNMGIKRKVKRTKHTHCQTYVDSMSPHGSPHRERSYSDRAGASDRLKLRRSSSLDQLPNIIRKLSIIKDISTSDVTFHISDEESPPV